MQITELNEFKAEIAADALGLARLIEAQGPDEELERMRDAARLTVARLEILIESLSPATART